MIRRRTLLAASATALAAPAIVERPMPRARSTGSKQRSPLEVNFAKSPRADILQAHQKDFEELTGIKVGSEQIPEQQQRPKVAMEMSIGHPSFDVVNVGMHVQKRLIEQGRLDGGSAAADRRQSLTNPGLRLGRLQRAVDAASRPGRTASSTCCR